MAELLLNVFTTLAVVLAGALIFAIIFCIVLVIIATKQVIGGKRASDSKHIKSNNTNKER